MSYNEHYYSDNYSTFDEWLNLACNRDESLYPFCRIPYEEWLNEYLENVNNKTVTEVKNLLRCLLVPINRPIDISNYENLVLMKQSNNKMLVEMANKIPKNESHYRIENGQDVWEGLTWVLELLPSRPYKVIEALGNYLISQPHLLDDRITGLEQCIEIIVAKFIDFENPLEKLIQLNSKEFEWLIEELYESMGYDTIWTPSTRDGGKDIIASIQRTDGNELVYVECKLYRTTKLKISDVRSFCNVITENKANRGVIFCTGYVNKNIKKYDTRIQVCTFEEINLLLNAYLGSDWVERLDILLDNKRRKYKKK